MSSPQRLAADRRFGILMAREQAKMIREERAHRQRMILLYRLKEEQDKEIEELHNAIAPHQVRQHHLPPLVR